LASFEHAVAPSRLCDGAQPQREPTKPFRGILETEVKQTRRSIIILMHNGVRSMLAEKFILVIESLIEGQGYDVQVYSDGAPRVLSSSPHVPIALPLSQSIASPRSATARCGVSYGNKFPSAAAG
jgi:hypothetical protein